MLLYAHDSRSPFFVPAAEWWQSCMNGQIPVGLCHPVIFAFIRISTSPRVYENPLSLQAAAAQVNRWFERRVTRVLLADENHHTSVVRLLSEAGSAGGNLVTDAQIAAIALAHRAEVHTADQDFRRFSNLSCHYPLSR
ncbi:MAG: PIN domain-containing protein [Gammaproteobacteria bacterium]|nr:PIN domain-containing protein [Gammaproteobacteria bacterium]